VRVVVDTNIVFSAILNSSGLIGELLLDSNDQFEFYAPDFLEQELAKYLPKLMKATSMNDRQVAISIRQILNKIKIISSEIIHPEAWISAYELTRAVDEKDTPFVAVAISLNAILWTGDKKLAAGLGNQSDLRILNSRELVAIKK
jgi:putative PIN family toxin of toxin-antitoxin system